MPLTLGESLLTPRANAKWLRLVEAPPSAHHGGQYRVYVIEVEPVDPECRFRFYVGYTSGTVEHRFQQHADGAKMAARIFKKTESHPRGRARALRIREDLMLGSPIFRSKEAALKAEGLLARRIEARGFQVCCDTKDRLGLKKQLRKLRASNA